MFLNFFFFFFAFGKFGSHGLFAIYWISRNNGPRCIGATLYIYIIFFFQRKEVLTFKQMIHMKCEDDPLKKKNKKKIEHCLLQILLGTKRVKNNKVEFLSSHLLKSWFEWNINLILKESMKKCINLYHSGHFQQTTIWCYFSYFSQKTGFDISCKLSPKETICMKCQILLSGKK